MAFDQASSSHGHSSLIASEQTSCGEIASDEIVWRWLKESILAYPQNWLKLTITDNQSYGVVLYPPKVLEASQLDYYNEELKKRGLPSLVRGKSYQPIKRLSRVILFVRAGPESSILKKPSWYF